ncbi:MAG: methyltransferase domain-containing protein [Bacteroidetes bacterium]|jgi:ubiquinone/menaquinone biosynthesis C-methylase UbiE|nr:methyltransferase domain-containing protein [Bacteroidota bacterium]
MSTKVKEKPTYSILAEIYDTVMEEVDYETWADYIDEIILIHHPEARDILELACGTGTVALTLEELECYNITATDASESMINIAKEKADDAGSEVRFLTMNMLDFTLTDSFDVIYMVFDSINYLTDEEQILKLHENVRNHLKPDGIFIYDFTTPRNSRNAIRLLNDERGKVGKRYRYHRESLFNAKKKIHTNRFEIEKLDAESGSVTEIFKEEHLQKIYTEAEIRSMIDKSDFEILEAYDGFKLEPAHRKSLRITMVLK